MHRLLRMVLDKVLFFASNSVYSRFCCRNAPTLGPTAVQRHICIIVKLLTTTLTYYATKLKQAETK